MQKKIQVTAKFSLYLKNVFVFGRWGPQSLSAKPLRKRENCQHNVQTFFKCRKRKKKMAFLEGGCVWVLFVRIAFLIKESNGIFQHISIYVCSVQEMNERTEIQCGMKYKEVIVRNGLPVVKM